MKKPLAVFAFLLFSFTAEVATAVVTLDSSGTNHVDSNAVAVATDSSGTNHVDSNAVAVAVDSSGTNHVDSNAVAIAVDSSGTPNTSTTAATSIQLTTFTVGAGTNRVLLATLSFGHNSGSPPASITVTWDFGGTNQALTQVVTVQSANGLYTTQIWRLIAPVSGNKTLRASWTNSNDVKIGAIEFSGVDQTTPIATADNQTGTNTTGTITVTVPSAPGDATVAVENNNSSSAPAMSATQLYSDNSAGTVKSGANYVLGGTSNVHTDSSCSTCQWTMVGVHVRAASQSGTVSLTTFTVGAGANRVLLAMLSFGRASGSAPTGITVTWGGQALTQVGTGVSSPNGLLVTQIWQLVNPTSGNLTLTATWTNASDVTLGAVEFSNVDQTNPIVTADNQTGSGASGTVTVTVPSVPGDATVAIDTIPHGTVPAMNQTSLWSDNVPNNNSSGANYALGGASNVHTDSSTTTKQWAMVGVHVQKVQSGTISLTTFTVGTGTNRVLLAMLSFGRGGGSAPTGITVTWGGQALTQVATVSSPNGLLVTQIWRRIAPTSGNLTLTATWTNASDVTLGAVEFSNVDQTNPIVTADNKTGSGTTGTITVTIPSAPGDATVAIDTIPHGTVPAMNQTSLWSDNVPNNNSSGANYALGGASNVHTDSSTTTKQWAMVGVHVQKVQTGTVSLTTFTVGTGGNRVLLAMLSFGRASGSAPTGITVTWGGQALTQVGTGVSSPNGLLVTQIWQLVNPTSGNLTLTATWTNASDVTLGAVEFSNVSQTTPIITADNRTGSGASGTVTVTVPSAPGDATVAIDTIPHVAGIVVDAVANASISSGSSLSWTHTASGTNRLVIVGVSWSSIGGPPSISSITYGGTAMTLIGSRIQSDHEMAMYQLIAPPTGAQTVSVTFSASPRAAVGGSVSFTGVHQTTPTGTFAAANGSSSSPSVTVTSAAAEIVIDTIEFDTGASTLTPGAGQTQSWNLNPITWGAGSTEAGAASVTMSWTPDASDNWAIGAVSVKPAAGAGVPPTMNQTLLWSDIAPNNDANGANYALSGASNVHTDSSTTTQQWAMMGVHVSQVPAPGDFNAFESSTVGATGVIMTKIAGATISFDIIALNTPGRTTVNTAFTGTVRVEVLNASNNSAALDGNGCRSTWTVIQTLSPDPTFIAGDLGRKTISYTVPNSYPDVRLRITYPAGAPTKTGCSNDDFAIRPNTLANFSVTDTNWLTAGTTRTLNLLDFTATTPTHKAGQPFTVRATAVNTASATTTNYTGTPTPTLTACGGAACPGSFGTFTLGASFAAGVLTSNAATYNNVGSFTLQLIDSNFASVDAGDTPGDCTATGRYVCSATLDVGRFVPDHFAVALNTPVFGTACGSFTYIGQAFNYTTAPVITVTAQDSANNTTTRYRTSGSCSGCFRITNASLTGRAYTAAVGTIDVSGLPGTGTDPVIAQTGTNGVSTLTFGSGTGLLFTRSTPVAPFNADVSLAINVIDADGVAYASNPAQFGAATAGNGIAFNSGKSMRFGQLVLGNALGSELLNLPIPIQTQYWNGTNFVTNTLDSCTTITASNITLSNYQGALTSGNLPSGNISISGTFNAGVGNLKLTKPSSAVNGSVDLCVDLGGDATCVATSAGMSYLQGVWSGTTYTLDPRARAAFGFGKGSYSGGGRDPFVYQRENY